MRIALLGSFLVLMLSSFEGSAAASTWEIPASLSRQVLAETVPFVFSPARFSEEDYRLEWVSSPIAGVSVSLSAKTFEWVRISKFLVLPRGRLRLEGQPSDAGTVVHNSYSHLISQGSADLPVALISGDQNLVEISIQRGGALLRGKVKVVFSPRPENAQRALIDTSCSPYGVEVDSSQLKKDTWIYVSCRYAYAKGAELPLGTLELLVFWDNVGQEIQLGEVMVPSTTPSFWPLRVQNQRSEIQLSSKGGDAKIQYKVSEKFHLASLGVGVGPYTYHFQGGGKNASGVAPLLTLYGSYFINESLRFVAFQASPIHSTLWSDTGLYFNSEQVRTLDERFSLNLLLGAHFLTHQYGGSWYGRMSAPQGVEMIFRDIGKRSQSVSVGAFIYPPINQSSYYNVWLRWGTPGFFFEFNYINWRQKTYSDVASSRAGGISIGMPLFRFF